MPAALLGDILSFEFHNKHVDLPLHICDHVLANCPLVSVRPDWKRHPQHGRDGRSGQLIHSHEVLPSDKSLTGMELVTALYAPQHCSQATYSITVDDSQED